MLQSHVKLVHLNSALAAHFLTAFGNAPWKLIAGGQERQFGVKQLASAWKWIGQQQNMQRNVFAPLPDTGGHVWHLAVRAPREVRPAEFNFAPTLTISADGYWLLWALQEPVTPGIARALSERLASEIGGTASTDEPVPLPGTVYFRSVGAKLQGRFPTQMLRPLATAYRLVEGQLADVTPGRVESVFRRADQVEVQPMRWIWRDMVALSEFTVLIGEPGVGKSQLALDIAARVTSGSAFPGVKELTERGSAIVLETEDDVASVVIPRLKAAGADMRKVLVHGQAMDLSKGVEALEEAARGLGDLKLLVISPLRMFFGDVEASRQVDTRARLDPLLRWAAARNVAVLGVAHKNAGKAGKSGEDMAGPKAFAQRARAVHSAVIDEDDPEPEIKKKRRMLITAKANNSPDTGRIAYKIQAAGESSRIKWL